MNKKFLSAILFGALMVTSTGTFVSCKDYDEDIENLQSQINNLATKSDVEAKLAQLQAAIDAAKAESATNAAKIAALTKCECDVDAMMKKIQDAVDADMAEFADDINALIEAVEELVGEIADFVTSVELDYRSNNDVFPVVNFFTLTEKENVFEDGLTGALTFTAGKQTQVAQDGFVVRVSPTNAVLTPEMVSLVNSKGENLDEYMDVKVEKYTDLLTDLPARGASNNGLWKITPVLKEYNKDQFAAMKLADVKKGDVYGNRIAYAIQINNALESAEARYVTSPYSITLGNWSEFVGNNGLYYTVDGVLVEKINNRFDASSKSLPNFSATTTEMYKELVWLNKTNSAANGPAATEMIVKGEKINVAEAWNGQPNGVHSVFDNRSEQPLALAVQGKPMTIAISDGIKDNDKDYEGKIAGLYVTLDYKENAVESAPSEWNAWNSYTYTGLNTVVAGTSIDITIDSKETINDIIGFRVYAVNLDGTLVDPDGRAFYVLVGEQAAETQTVTATITPTNKAASHTTTKVALTDAQSEVITKLLANPTSELKMYEKNPVISKEYPVAYNVTFTVKDKKAVEAVFTLTEEAMKNMVNDKTYKATLTYKTATGHVAGEVNLELTKSMPTAFPTDFAFRPKQETTEGSGKFIAYMIPSNDSYVVADAYATDGIKDLNNVFYGLDEYYQFQFATSKYDAKDKVDVASDLVTKAEGYVHTVAAKYIDNATAHAVSVWYTYPGISTYAYTDKDGKEAWKIGETHKVEYAKALEATYACWEDASAFAWGETKVNNVAVSAKPVLQWTAEGVKREANLAAIISTNAYNNDYFGLDLNELINISKWLKVAEKDAADKAITTIKLVAGEQVNPYYVPTIEGSKIVFEQAKTQVDAAPTADHEETLVITLVDAFGHQVSMSLPVTVKAPEKK